MDKGNIKKKMMLWCNVYGIIIDWYLQEKCKNEKNIIIVYIELYNIIFIIKSFDKNN